MGHLTLVFAGRREALEKAHRLLEKHGIGCRMTRPRRDEGHLRVVEEVAERARSLLAHLPGGRVISASEAAWFVCPACGASLTSNGMQCPACHASIGDPHGR